MKESKKYTKGAAAARAGMDPKTARKYLKANALPSELKKPRKSSNKPALFDIHWSEIEGYLGYSPALESKTLLGWLVHKYPDHYNAKQLRSLQRRIKKWRVLYGPEREIYFSQIHEPGEQSQSDYTNMNSLGVTICGHRFDHLLFHFMLPCSRWEAANICFSESFESLCEGYERAVWLLGAVPNKHRTDNLSAATRKMGSSRAFTKKWSLVMDHYQVKPSRNNPGQSHENGSVEKSHDLLKKDIDQQLMMRGSRDFSSEQEYDDFIQSIINQRNQLRQTALINELEACQPLPASKWYHPKTTTAKVSKESLIFVETVPYSVPSRLIHQQVTVKLYPDKLGIYYGSHLIETAQRKSTGENGVNYRHIINQLVRKPGAFEHYKYKESLFPRLEYRRAYDLLNKHYESGHKHYLKILQYAAETSETEVAVALELLISSATLPTIEQVKMLVARPIQEVPEVEINQPHLSDYDRLLCMGGDQHVMH